jgi:hypothetical protein
MHLSDLPQVSGLGTRNEESIGQMHSGRLPTVKDSCSKFDQSMTSDDRDLSFLGNGEARVTMPLLQTGQGKSRGHQDNAFCYELMAQLKANFRFGLTAGMSEQKCTFHIGKAHVQKLPLFLDLVEVARRLQLMHQSSLKQSKVQHMGRNARSSVYLQMQLSQQCPSSRLCQLQHQG